MDVRKVIDVLTELASEGPKTPDTFIKATVLLNVLEELNSNVDADAGEYRDGIVDEKISQARGWFAHIGGFDDATYPDPTLPRVWALSALDVMKQHTTKDGKFVSYWK